MAGTEPSPSDPPPAASEPGTDDDVVEAEVLDPEAEEVAAEVAARAVLDAAALGPDSVEDLVRDLERIVKERDEYLDTLRRTQADFENYRKRISKQQAEAVDRAVGAVIEQLLPTLDVGDAAAAHGAADAAVFTSLLSALEKTGLERIDPSGDPFDPNDHEAVMHEPAEAGEDGPVVTEVLRTGYAWKGRLLRPAMVKVRG